MSTSKMMPTPNKIHNTFPTRQDIIAEIFKGSCLHRKKHSAQMLSSHALRYELKQTSILFK